MESTCDLTPVFAIATTDVLPLIDESFRHSRPMLIPNLQRCSKHQFCQHENCKNDFPTGLYPLVGLPTLDCVMRDMLGYSVVRVWLRSGRHCPFMPFFLNIPLHADCWIFGASSSVVRFLAPPTTRGNDDSDAEWTSERKNKWRLDTF